MPVLSTAQECCARMDARISEEDDPQHRRWLQMLRDHWWGEVTNDVELIMTTMSKGAISYSLDGHPFMTRDPDAMRIATFDDTRRMYERMSTMGVRMAGPEDDVRIAFDDDAIIKYQISSAVFPGSFLSGCEPPVDPDRYYLVRWPCLVIIPFDGEGLMQGEHIVNGAPILVREVSSDHVDCLVQGPLPSV